MSVVPVCHKSLQSAYRHRFALYAANALALTLGLLRTNSAADSGQRVFEQGYEAIFIGSGAGLPRFMNIPGENLKGVYSANEFLTRVNLMKAYKEGSDTPIKKNSSVAVVGGGNVAMDAARCAKRLGAENDVQHKIAARLYHWTAAPTVVRLTKLHLNTFHSLNKLVLIAKNLGRIGKSAENDSLFFCVFYLLVTGDCVVMSIGTSPNPLIRNTTKGLDTNKHGCFIADEAGQTSREGVFAGGDAVTGAAAITASMRLL